MYYLQNVPLSGYSTMRLGGDAAYLTEINTVQDVPKAIEWAENNRVPVIMIGGGSNIIWKDEGFPGLVIVNKIRRFEVQEIDQNTIYATIGGGEIWDEAVEKLVDMGFSGVELLSLIPGTAGAAPVQNIGAYGCELSDTLATVEAYDSQTQSMTMIRASECAFGYRTSRFKTTDRSRFFITAITIRLGRTPELQNPYHSLEQYFDDHSITEYTPQNIRKGVIAIRSAKLPDPAVVANTGSFFANPTISRQQMQDILDRYPDLAGWPSKMMWDLPNDQVKIAAGALIDYLGMRGWQDDETGMATWPKQGLVLVNQHAQSTADLLKFKQKIVNAVSDKFNIELEQEPELI